MKKILLITIIALSIFSITSTAHAITTLFTFENVGSGNLATYMTNAFGQTVNPDGAVWYNNSALFGSDVLYAPNGGSFTLDFDTAARSASAFEITTASFTWGVYDATDGYDFGMDIYNDATGDWINNVFTRNNVDYSTGNSGNINFNSAYQVTALRFHDSGVNDVGIDNLRIIDNRPEGGSPVPEPATMSLLGMGVLGLLRFKRKA
jgi:hypothetical protein